MAHEEWQGVQTWLFMYLFGGQKEVMQAPFESWNPIGHERQLLEDAPEHVLHDGWQEPQTLTSRNFPGEHEVQLPAVVRQVRQDAWQVAQLLP